MHCFGHIHEDWGAKLVAWRDEVSETPSHFADVDNGASVVIEKRAGLVETKFDTPEQKEEKRGNREMLSRDGCRVTRHCAGDELPLESGKQTLFVNAAVQGGGEFPVKPPWLVEIDLPKAP